MVEEQIKGNMENGVFKGSMWETITQELNKRSGKLLTTKQVFQKHNRLRGKQRKWSQLLNHTGLGWDEATQTVTCSDEVWEHVVAANRNANNLRKKGCPDYDKLKQLFAPSTATGHLQISSNTPALNSDEERELEDELAADAAPIHLDDDCYTPNLDSIPRNTEETNDVDQTQAAGKRPVQEASAKGKKVAKKSDKVSEMTVALKDYTAMTRERFSGNRGKSSGTSEQFAQSAVGGDPCSLGKAIDMLNQYVDLSNKEFLKISKALHVKENRVVFMGMLENRRRAWMEEIINPED
ncbi:uncharacterized protein LOC112040995 [Quercus suber]|uniref:uncharacterized protein LOC112040995 n=1 Tax=Quercus suber TaxID=58331 RepID=UPI000D28C339|nr:l10-interacting myb domain-containing protein [Quercus suber]